MSYDWWLREELVFHPYFSQRPHLGKCVYDRESDGFVHCPIIETRTIILILWNGWCLSVRLRIHQP